MSILIDVLKYIDIEECKKFNLLLIDKFILIKIAHFMGKNPHCWYSIENLSKKLNYDESHLRKRLFYLQKIGLLKIEKRIRNTPLMSVILPNFNEQLSLKEEPVGSQDDTKEEPTGSQDDTKEEPTGSFDHDKKEPVGLHNKKINKSNNKIKINIKTIAHSPNERSHEQPKELSMKKAPLRFDEFWKAYPRKIGKKKALRIWTNRNLDEHAKMIIDDVRMRIEHDQAWKKGVEFIPHPTTWLNGDRWEDEMLKDDPNFKKKKEPTLLENLLAFGGYSMPTKNTEKDITPESLKRLQ